MENLLYTSYFLIIMSTTVYSIRCPACTKPENDQRVCGTDGKTYASVCYLERRVCKTESSDLTVEHSGKCKDNTKKYPMTTPLTPLQSELPVKSIPVSVNQPLTTNSTDHHASVQVLRCNLTLEPVCGTDGITYPSPCFLTRFATLPGKSDLSIAWMGYCVSHRPKVNLEPSSKPDFEIVPEPDNGPKLNLDPPENEPEAEIESDSGRIMPITSEKPTETTTKPLTTTAQKTTRKYRSRPSRKPRPTRRRKLSSRIKPPSRKRTTVKPNPEPENPVFDSSDVWQVNPKTTMKYESSVAPTEASLQSESSDGIAMDFDLGFGGGSDQWLVPKPDPTNPVSLVTKTELSSQQPEQPEDPETDSFGTNIDFGFGGSDLWFVPKQPEPETTVLTPTTATSASAGVYYGKLIGTMVPKGSRRATHRTEGVVYAIDQSTIRIVNFTYDGNAPDAFFWAGSTGEPDDTGDIIPDENGRKRKLKAYDNQDLILSLPKGRTLANYKWIAVWCRRFRENFADVYIPSDFVAPSDYDLGVLGYKPRVNNVRSPSVVVVDTKTIRLHSLTYDGTAPDASFWVGLGTPDAGGRSVPYENGSSDGVLPKFRRDTITIKLPDDVKVFDIDYLSVWSVITQQDFGHVMIPNRGMLNIPPYIKTEGTPTQTPTTPVRNSESLSTDYTVSWLIDGDEIEVELSARLQSRMYMAFGFSGSKVRSVMFGSDVAVAWMNGNTPVVEDYYLGGYSQCSVGSGACKDESFVLPGVNDYTDVMGSTVDGVTTISYRRKLNTGDALDMTISLTGSMYIVWAIGPINDDGLVSKHIDIGGDSFSFGRGPVNNAQSFITSEQIGTAHSDTWPEIVIEGKDVTTFDAKIGPNGGGKGHTAVIGNTGWGFVWYINEKLAPRLILKRGVEYTFRVFGGDDESLIAQYHPFYITTDPIGGNPSSTGNIFKYQTIYAGPTVGGYCEYSNKKQDKSEQSSTFEEYFKTLKEKCNRRVLAGVLTWTPDANTPDTVYYQCYTHRYFGWKIEVVNDFLSL